jgi:hypothetical protein
MDIIIVLGIVGSIASVIGVYLAAPNPRSRFIHAIYGFLFVVLSGYLVHYYQRDAEVASLEIGIERLFDSTKYSQNDRGFMLASLALLEKHKERFPETYSAAKQLCLESGVTGEPKGKLSVYDGAHAMHTLLKALAPVYARP